MYERNQILSAFREMIRFDEEQLSYVSAAAGISADRLKQLELGDEPAAAELLAVCAAAAYLDEDVTVRPGSAREIAGSWLDSCFQSTYRARNHMYELMELTGTESEKELLEQFYIFADGSSLCAEGMDVFLEKLLPEMKRLDKTMKITVPVAVTNRLQSMAEDPEVDQLTRASVGVCNLNTIQQEDLLVVRGDANDKSIIATFISALSKFKPAHSLLLLSNDEDLNEAVEKLNDIGIEGDDILVAKIRRDGRAVAWDAPEEEVDALIEEEKAGWADEIVEEEAAAAAEDLTAESEEVGEELFEDELEEVGEELLEDELEEVGEELFEDELEEVGEELLEDELEEVGEELFEDELEEVGEELLEDELEEVGEELLEDELEEVGEELLEDELEEVGEELFADELEEVGEELVEEACEEAEEEVFAEQIEEAADSADATVIFRELEDVQEERFEKLLEQAYAKTLNVEEAAVDETAAAELEESLEMETDDVQSLMDTLLLPDEEQDDAEESLDEENLEQFLNISSLLSAEEEEPILDILDDEDLTLDPAEDDELLDTMILEILDSWPDDELEPAYVEREEQGGEEFSTPEALEAQWCSADPQQGEASDDI